MNVRLAGNPRYLNLARAQFFFPNVKSRLVLQDSFLANHYLTPRRRAPIRTLSCQDLGAHAAEGLNVPFKVTPKTPRAKATTASCYLKLAKPNLTFLVTLSSICSYALSPNSVSVTQLALLAAGTALCSASANAVNMAREPEFDRKMTRTALRPVVLGQISPGQAFQFAAAAGAAGWGILHFGVNPTVAALGVCNIALYGWVYTSLKRRSILNTWVGAIVGAIPPLMGWASSSLLWHPGSWCLAALLYAWQFPHFNALSHNLAAQYKGAGYVMTAAENPRLNARVAFRYSLLMIPICFGLSYFGVTDAVFPIDSSVANVWMAYLAFRFWQTQRGPTTPASVALAGVQAKKLFWCSVWQLPAVLVLAMLHKKGQWERLWNTLGWD